MCVVSSRARMGVDLSGRKFSVYLRARGAGKSPLRFSSARDFKMHRFSEVRSLRRCISMHMV